MDWIKKSYEQAILLLLACVLLATSALLIARAKSFPDQFAPIHQPVIKSTKVPPLETKRLDDAAKTIAGSPAWVSHKALLFVARKYLIREGKLYDPTEGSEKVHDPVPNGWFTEHHLDLLSRTVLEEDPDGDGFTNLDEWVGSDPAAPGSKSTDPNDKNSHPGYLTKLKLKQFIQMPFRLVLKSEDSGSFQINTLDVKQPSQFIEIGAKIAGTKYTITGPFVSKKFTDANDIEQDVSELTIQQDETKEKLVLIMGKVIDSPDSYALFEFGWRGLTEFRVKKGQVFALRAEPDVQYKLIDINTNEATIDNLKSGVKGIKIPRK